MKYIVVMICLVLLSACKNESDEPAPLFHPLERWDKDTWMEEMKKGDHENSVFDCTLPDDGVAEIDLSDDIKKILQLECSRHGHSIGAQFRHVWLFGQITIEGINIPNAYVVYASGERVDPSHSDFGAYFTNVSAKILSPEESYAVIENMAEHYPEMIEVEVTKKEKQWSDISVTEISTISNTGLVQKVILAELDESTTAGYGCNPDCNPDNVFSVQFWH